MNIVVLGAGAIGSFFGGLLSKKHNVILVGKKDHVHKINNKGLQIKGKTRLQKKIPSVETIQELSSSPDLVLLTVKSFDTLQAISEAKPIISSETKILSFQNGLDNIDQINKVVKKHQIIAGITTHGVQYIEPGLIYHKGSGSTVIGEISGKKTQRIQQIASIFNGVHIPVTVSSQIIEDIWKKAIVNASINPLTAIFQCPNGYLVKNPILTELVEKICFESTIIAQKKGFSFQPEELLGLTMKVISQTEKNHSSMLQSIQRNKPTEINEINGKLADIGKAKGCDTALNELLTKIIRAND
jgi:2-dehydropantoate 2-reductase